MANLAHVDLHTGDASKLNHAGFNVVIGGHDSSMTFYKLPETESPLKFTMAKTPYIDWHVIRDKLELVDTFDDYSRVAMVRVDIPHAIKTGQWPRLCFSFRCDRAGDNPWEQTVEDFAKAGLLIPREQPTL